MTQPRAEHRTKLTNAEYVAITPPAVPGPRYQLINGELIKMAGASNAHQVFALRCGSTMLMQADELDIGEIRIAPYDVHIDEFNTYQPDLLFVSNARRHIFNLDGRGITGAPDVVVEILSDSTRRRDLNDKLPIYAANGVREVWIVDLDAATVTVYSANGSSLAPVRAFDASDTLTSDAMPGVVIDLAPIFARTQAVP